MMIIEHYYHYELNNYEHNEQYKHYLLYKPFDHHEKNEHLKKKLIL